MSQTDYAQLDAEEQDAQHHPELLADEEAVLYPQEHASSAAPAQQPSAAPEKQSRHRKKKPLTDEQRLANALAAVETLQAKVIAARDERRSRVVEDLYRKHGIAGEQGDLGEAKRIAALRRALGV